MRPWRLYYEDKVKACNAVGFTPDCNTQRCVISSSSFYPDPLRAGVSEPHKEEGERGEAHAHLIRRLLQTSP